MQAFSEHSFCDKGPNARERERERERACGDCHDCNIYKTKYKKIKQILIHFFFDMPYSELRQK